MGTTSDELLKIARRCADKITVSKRGSLPALEDVEEQCEDAIEQMLAMLQDDDVFGEVDLDEQQKLIDQIEAALPENVRALVGNLNDQHVRQVWIQQEAAYHLGVAIGMRLARETPAKANGEEDEEDEEDDREGPWGGLGPDEEPDEEDEE
jgi:hypothetical protein